jgi:hypothetical protein
MEINLPEPLIHQMEIWQDPSRFKLLNCGRRWGKTVIGSVSSLYGHGPIIDGKPKYQGALFGKNIGWLTSTNKNADAVIWPRLMKYFEKARDRGRVRIREKMKTIELKETGGLLSVWSAQAPNNIRGDGLDGVVYDEAAFGSGTLWFDVLRPALMDSLGWGFLISTPNGMNWWYKLYENAVKMRNWKRWTRTSKDNPLISDEEVEDLIQEAILNDRDPEQEVFARFRQKEGAIWEMEYFDDMLVDGYVDHGDPTSFAIAGLDHAKGLLQGDYPALSNIFFSRGIYSAKCNMKKMPEQEKIHDIVEWIADHKPRYRPVILAVEIGAVASGTRLDYDLFASRLQKGISKANLDTIVRLQSHDQVAKQVRLLRLSGMISQRRLKIVSDVCGNRCFRQLKNLGVKGMADDGPDSLEISHRMMQTVARSLL